MFRFAKVAAISAVMTAVAFVANAATYQGSTLAGGAGGIGLAGGNNGSIYALDPTQYPVLGAYDNTPTTPASDWVWAAPNSPLVSQALQFVFTFTLTAAEAANATLSGFWGVDNLGTVRLNGTEIASLPFAAESFNQPHALSATSGFVAGLNTLTFDVENYLDGFSEDLAKNPAALRASVTVVAPVPVPAAMPLLGGAVVALGFAARRKRRAA